MLKTYMVICAEDASIDTATNKIILYGILDSVMVPHVPAILPRLACVIGLIRDVDDPPIANIKLTVRSGGEAIAQTDVVSAFESNLQNRTVIRIDGLPIMNIGNLIFEVIDSDKNIIGSWTVYLTKATNNLFGDVTAG
jgi:hypothetical protein